MKHKIIFLTSSLNVGGAEKFLVSLLNSLDRNLFELKLISFSDKNVLSDQLKSEIIFTSLHRKNKFDLNPILRLRSIISESRPNLIVCLNLFSFFLLNLSLILKSKNILRIISYHTTIPKNKNESILFSIYFKFLKKSDKIIVVSHNQLAYTSTFFKISTDKFITIHNGVDLNHWTLPPAWFDKYQFREVNNLPILEKIIVIAAAFRSEKNHIGAVNALKILHDRYGCKAHLLFLGGGELIEKVKSHVNGLNLKDYVVFKGIQNDLLPFYWASDIFSLCSTSVETFSIAALEAMACGLPCVLTDIGGANEMIKNNINGLLSLTNSDDIASSWYEVLSSTNYDPEKIRSIAVNRFSLTMMTQSYSKLFTDLISKS